LPKEVFFSTFLDALNQCFESFWNKNSTEKSLKYSTRGIAHAMSIMKNLSRIDNKKLALVSLYSGLSISITKTGICHSISYPLTSHYKIPHGIACMFSFIEVLSYNIKNDDGRFSKYFPDSNSLVKTFENFFDRISFTNKINQLVSKDELLLLKDKIFDPDRMNNNFKQLSKNEIVNIYLKSVDRTF
jgi:alcohol dehydrogenase